MTNLLIFGLVGLSLSSPVPQNANANRDSKPPLQEIVYQADGQTRKYQDYPPPGYAAAPVPTRKQTYRGIFQGKLLFFSFDEHFM